MEDGFDNADVCSAFENLAIGHQPRLRVKEAVTLSKLQMSEGCVFEVEDADFEEDYDDGEEVYDDDTLSHFYYSNPRFDDKIKQEVLEGENSVKDEKCERVPLWKYLATTDFASVEEGMTSLFEGGLVKKLIIQEGNGQQIPENCKIFFHYEAMYEGGTEVFDSTLIRKHPACFDMRQPRTIPGLEIALRSMTIGEVARFIIYPELAFGNLGCAPRIPKNVKLLYVIQMLQLLDEKRMSMPQFMTVQERAQLPFSVIMETSKQIQTDGNGYYANDSYHSAIRKWRKAVNMLEDYPVTLEEDERVRTDLIGQLYANLAQGYLKLEKPAQACSACKVGLKVVSGRDSFKLIIRFAKAKLMLGDYEASLSLCKEAVKFNPRSSDVTKIRNDIKEAKRERDNIWRNIYNKPKTSPKKLDTKDSLPPKMSTSKTDSKVECLPEERGCGGADKCTEQGLSDESSDVMRNIDLDDIVPDYAYSKKLGFEI